jgi:hypothetical protein
MQMITNKGVFVQGIDAPIHKSVPDFQSGTDFVIMAYCAKMIRTAAEEALPRTGCLA